MERDLILPNDVYVYHGWREQCKHIIEEVYELTEAIHDFELKDEQINALKSWNNMCEEIADVEFMLEQIKSHYLINRKNIDAWKDYKKRRESKRIKEGYYDKNSQNVK